jgi:hypothetical protein
MLSSKISFDAKEINQSSIRKLPETRHEIVHLVSYCGQMLHHGNFNTNKSNQ